MNNSEQKIYSVGEINGYISQLIRQDTFLKQLTIRGEIGNFSRASSGHLYFNLKDQKTYIKAIVWRNLAQKINQDFPDLLKEGANVIATGRIQVYEGDGSYSFHIDSISFEGAGDLFLQFEQLKRELYALGIFEKENKQLILRFNYKVGIVTSKEGAVLHDIQSTIKRRFPNVLLRVYNTPVQGKQATPKIIAALKAAEADQHDVIILARGGGSLEDLFCFNDRNLALEIYNATTPIISAIGHETDFTIADFVADLRAPTPTAAAELLNPTLSSIREEVKHLNQIMRRQMHAILKDKIHQVLLMKQFFQTTQVLFQGYRMQLLTLEKRLYALNVPHRIKTYRETIKALLERVNVSFRAYLRLKKVQIKHLEVRLQSTNPLNQLSKGYSYARVSGRIIKSIQDVIVDDTITLDMNDGQILAKVVEKHPRKD